MKFADSKWIQAARDHRPSPPVRPGKPGKPPKGGKAETDTLRQRLFEQAVWDIAEQRGDPRIPTTFVIDGVGDAYLDQGCISMASDWLDHRISNDGWPVGLSIKPDVWARGRPTPSTSSAE